MANMLNAGKRFLLSALLVSLVFASGSSAAARIPNVLGIRERVAAVNAVTVKRLDTLLPRLMRETGFDMWIIPANEDRPDPVLQTMIPYNTWNRRQHVVVIFDRGPEKGVERLNVSRMGMGGFFQDAWNFRAYDRDKKEGQWEALARIVRERDPKKIGINESDVIWGADGLSVSLKRKLVDTIGPGYSGRLVSAEPLATRWLETLLEDDIALMEQGVRISRAIIAETYSNAVITPGVTTVDDLIYQYWQRILNLGLEKGFNPEFNIIRSTADQEKYGKGDRVIRPGDIIHCDVGLVYLRYYTDQQEVAYVLRRGETDVPESFKQALAEGNRLQDIYCGEFQTGRTGNQMLSSMLAKARQAGIPNPKVYSHSLGYYLHEPGPLIGLPEEQVNTGGRGDVALVPMSTFVAELSVGYPVPEWNGKLLTLGIEQDVVYTGKDVTFLAGRQTAFHVIK
jgi:hypothetical protein